MEVSPKIGVIIPVYNCEKYVGAAVESVLNQIYKNIIVVLVDDGSIDSSLDICEQYASKNNRVYVIHKKNGGVSSARNAGIDYVLKNFADVLYITFLDADDKWRDDFFSDEVIVLLRKKCDLVGFQSCNTNNSMSRRTQPRILESQSLCGGACNVWKHSSQHFAAMWYSTRLLREYMIRFCENLHYSEDIIFRMQCIYVANKLELYDRVLYYYRHSATSAVHSRKYGIEYFTPIIDAWIQSDEEMKKWRTPYRGELWEGRAMAAVCIVDMVVEHYEQFGSIKEVEKLFRERPDYLELITSPFAYNRPDSGLRWKKMNTHPIKFRLRCYARGIAKMFMKCMYKLAAKNNAGLCLIEKTRYPIELQIVDS